MGQMKNIVIKIMLIFLIATSLIAFSTHEPVFGNIDVKGFYAVNSGLKNHFFDAVMPQISRYLNKIVFLGGILLLINKKNKKLLIVFMIGFLLADSLVWVLKDSTQVERPFGTLKDVYVNDIYSNWEWITLKDPMRDMPRSSFPSGHTAQAFFFLGILWAYKRLRGPLFIAACLVGFSRLYVGVHYPSDVLIGGIFGFLTASAARYLCTLKEKKYWVSIGILLVIIIPLMFGKDAIYLIPSSILVLTFLSYLRREYMLAGGVSLLLVLILINSVHGVLILSIGAYLLVLNTKLKRK